MDGYLGDLRCSALPRTTAPVGTGPWRLLLPGRQGPPEAGS